LAGIIACGSETGAVSCEGAGSSEFEGLAVTQEAAAEMSIADLLSSEGHFSKFQDLTSRTVSEGLDKSWLEIWDFPGSSMGDNRDGVTVFVPTDAAFESLDPGLLATIQDPGLDNEIRYNLLGHHYIHRLYPASEFEPGSQRTWRGGGSVELTLDPPTWGGCPVVQTDIRVNNGYIHVVDGIVIPLELRQLAVG
jgi:hypothetical protein